MNIRKHLSILLAAFAMLVSCTNLDEVWAELRDHEERIERLETVFFPPSVRISVATLAFVGGG